MSPDKDLIEKYGLRKADGSPFKILVVDDSVFIQKLLTRMIKSAGYELAASAEDGLQAIENFKALSPDLVTMDITMPNMNGIQAIEELMQIDPNAKIIVASSIGHEEIVKEAIGKGAKHYIVKPLQVERTLRVIKNVLGKEVA